MIFFIFSFFGFIQSEFLFNSYWWFIVIILFFIIFLQFQNIYFLFFLLLVNYFDFFNRLLLLWFDIWYIWNNSLLWLEVLFLYLLWSLYGWHLRNLSNIIFKFDLKSESWPFLPFTLKANNSIEFFNNLLRYD